MILMRVATTITQDALTMTLILTGIILWVTVQDTFKGHRILTDGEVAADTSRRPAASMITG